MARISLYLARHLCTAPRVIKEADALALAGHDVSVHGYWWDPRLVERDRVLMAGRNWRLEPFADGRPGSIRRSWQWFGSRLRSRVARGVFRHTGKVLPGALGYGVDHLLRHARDNITDLTIAHAEGALWTASQLRRNGRRVGVDFEDWFSRDLDPAHHRDRPVAALAELEKEALHHDRYLVTTSAALATALHEANGGSLPKVIYNTFPFAPVARQSVASVRPVRLHWFSLKLGPARGLETLFAALPHLTGDWQLSLRCEDDGGYFAKLMSSISSELQDRVSLHPTVPNDQLTARTAEHDIGLALEVSNIPSRNLTITNKIFQYLHSGLAIVASDTAGHREVLDRAPAAGVVCKYGDSAALAEALNHWIANPNALAATRDASLNAAQTTFDHTAQVSCYAELAAQALSS